MNSIRKMKANELKDIYKHIKKDFAPGEYAPYLVLHHQLKKGIQEGFIFCMDGIDAAYLICSSGHVNGHILLSLFAVFEEFRRRGIGSAFLKEIIGVYEDKQSIIVEVEKPEDSASDDERTDRLKRIGFYEKAGFYLIPNVDYTIWDVPLHLMAYPVSASIQSINDNIKTIMYDVYLELMGKHLIHKMVFR